MNKTVLRGKWRQARGGVKTEWGRLTDNERRVLDGRIDQLLGLFQERYGYTRARAADALKGYLGTHARKPAPPLVPQKNRFLLFSTIGLALLSAVGWVAFIKLLSGPQPYVDEAELAGMANAELEDFAMEDFEAEDFEALSLI